MSDTPDKPVVTPAKRLEQFIAVRDKIEQMKERHKQELAPLNDALIKLNGILLQHCIDQGIDSIKVSGVGTAYKKSTNSASIADPVAFQRHVIGTEAWELADWKANAPAVAKYIEEHGDAPPGVNFSVRVNMGVRRGDAT